MIVCSVSSAINIKGGGLHQWYMKFGQQCSISVVNSVFLYGVVVFVFMFVSLQRYDFFLVSQHVRQGTVTPTHYNVVADNTGLKPDHMQRLDIIYMYILYNLYMYIHLYSHILIHKHACLRAGSKVCTCFFFYQCCSYLDWL